MERGSSELLDVASRIRAVAVDVDGTLTDGGMYYFGDNSEGKKFNVRDGVGTALLHEAGIKVVFITGESHPSVARRAKKLKVAACFLGVKDKVSQMREWLGQEGIEFAELAVVGDEINDLPLLKRAGLAFCPKDANPVVVETVNVVTDTKGGEGVLREIAFKLLRSSGKLDSVLSSIVDRYESSSDRIEV